MSDFSILLREQPAAAIAERLDYLESKAKAARLDLESAKLSSFALAVLGLGLSANPLVGLLGGIGAIGYAGALVADYMATGRFCPVPALRKGVGELLAGFSAHGDDDQDPDMAEVEALASCLPPREAKEFWLLSLNSDRLLDHLLSQGPEQRLNGYGLAVRNPRLLAKVQPAQQLPPAAVPQLPAPQPPLPQPPAPTVGPTTRLGAIAVAAVPAEQGWDEDEIAPPATAVDILQECLGYPAILIYGPSGSGKSTLAQWLISQRLAAGHHCEILDPHAAYGAWGDLPVYGGGMDYQACDDRLVAFAELVKSRYQVLNTRPNFNPKPHTLLTEEFTNWASHCPHAGQFFASSMSDLRKVNMFAVYVAHGRTLTSLGGKSGVAEQRDQSLLEIELSTSIGPGGMPIPSRNAKIYYPGQKGSPVVVNVPALTGSPIPAAAKQQRSPNLESAYSADSADETIALVRETLIQAGEPLLGSVIRQKKSRLKEGLSREELDSKLRLMAMEGFIRSDGQEPPRYSLP